VKEGRQGVHSSAGWTGGKMQKAAPQAQVGAS
jgi:hypothetical protein